MLIREQAISRTIVGLAYRCIYASCGLWVKQLQTTTLWSKYTKAQASHQPSEWCIRFAQMGRCVFTNRHKAVLLAWLKSMVPLEEPQNHWFILPHSMLSSPKGHHQKKAFTINISLKIWPIRNYYHQNNLPFCVTRLQHSSIYLTLLPTVCYSKLLLALDPCLFYYTMYSRTRGA